MKKAVMIGGRGKVGTYLVPMLVRDGYEVISVSRGNSAPKVSDSAWSHVRSVTLDRGAADFPARIAELNADVVVDMICFQAEDMRRLMEALRGRVKHYLVCGSAWMHGHSSAVPVKEEDDREPLEEYGVQKHLMDVMIGEMYRAEGFPGTAVHPGHIVCPGDVPINPQGFKGLSAFETLRAGKALYLPNFGMETLHHVHAEDVAGVFLHAIRAGEPAYGQGFHAASAQAVTLRGYAMEAATWFGMEADLRFEGFEKWKTRVSADEAEQTLTHIMHSPCCSMQKAYERLRFTPRHTSYDAIRTCLRSFDLL